MPSIYIAGPMSGYPEFNFPAFFSAQEKLEAEGWTVFNPAAKETEKEVQKDVSFASGDNTVLVSNGWDYKTAFMWDCDKVINGDAIYMLPGWEKSAGASAEHAIAKFIQKQNPNYRIIYG